MKKIVYVCDRCRIEITGDIFKVIPERIDRETEDYTTEPPYFHQKDKHYCVECTRQVMIALNMGIPSMAAAEEPAVDPDQEEDPKEETQDGKIK